MMATCRTISRRFYEPLEIKFTEEDNPAVLETLRGLNTMGIRIRHWLLAPQLSARFTFNKIKIDRTLVPGQAHDQGVE